MRAARVIALAGRGLWLSLASGGWYYLRAWRLAYAVGRQAPCFAEGEVLLVPGFVLDGDEVTQAYARRLRRALRLWRPGRRLLLSGMAADPESQSEALAGYSFLRDVGLPPSVQVDLDIEARDTRENLRAAHHLLGAGQTLVIISNRWHLARCALLARELELPAKLCAAERRWQNDVFSLLAISREALALLGFLGRAALRHTPRELLDSQR